MTDQLQGLLKQLGSVQANMKEMQEKLAQMEVTGESGAGLVKVTMNGRHDVKNVEIDPSLLQEDREMLEDLLAAAVNDAVRRVEEGNREHLTGLAAGLNLPGGFPFKA